MKKVITTEEIRIDVDKQSPEELAKAKECAQLTFKLNHTMPLTPEYNETLHKLFPDMGEGSRVNAPLTVVRAHMVKISSSPTITTWKTAESSPANPYTSAARPGWAPEPPFCQA